MVITMMVHKSVQLIGQLPIRDSFTWSYDQSNIEKLHSRKDIISKDIRDNKEDN